MLRMGASPVIRTFSFLLLELVVHSMGCGATQKPDHSVSRLAELLVRHPVTSSVNPVPFQDLLYTSVPRKKPIRLPTESWLHLSLFLLMAGDIESNPGPRKPKYPCGVCSAAVKSSDPAVCCDQCGMWLHNRCSGLSPHMYELMKHTSGTWICPSCGMPSFSSSLFSASIDTSNSFNVLETDVLPKPQHSSTPSKVTSHNTGVDRNKIKVISVNVNSLRGKTLLMEDLIFEQDPDVILCQETKLDSSVANAELFPSAYTVFRKDRTLSGGGVCVAVKSHLQAIQCHDLENELEALWIQLQTSDHQPLYLCSFYRPPDKGTEYTSLLRFPLEVISTRHRNQPPLVVLAGDFNYHSINWDLNVAPSDGEGNILVDILDDFHLQQLVSSPTRFARTTSSLLDLVVTSHPTLISDCSVGQEFSDHCILSFNISKRVACSVNPGRRIYLYNRGSYTTIRQDMLKFGNIFFASKPESSSVDANWSKFKSALSSSVTTNIPSKLVFSHNKKPPWLSIKVRRLIRKRNQLANVACKTNSPIDRDRFRKARNTASREIHISYQNHLNSVISNLGENPRGFYRFIKSKRVDSTGIPSLKTSSDIVSSDNGKATVLNEYFASVFTKENLATLPTVPSSYPDMPEFEVSCAGVERLLAKLDIKKSVGPDDISPRVMKEACTEIAPVLTFIFNQSLSSCEIPEDWRIANIFALHKKGAKELPENYRPISLTSISSKILEHIVYSSISRYLSENDIISPRQHGFRPGFSCETQLVLSIDDWAKSVDRGLRTDMAIFDFSKAFDSVPHQRLLTKLHAYGIRNNILKWISTFLTSRRQRVVVNGCQSSWLPVASGVPQGTVLGPLLFLLYINDITCEIRSQIRLFADDCIVYRTITNPLDSAILQQDIDSLQSWADTWQMQFNSRKCHIMSISRQRCRPHTVYKLGSMPLSYVDSYPYLGVTVSSDMRWHNHISTVAAKATRMLNFVRRNIYHCSSEAKSLAYLSLVRPHLEYASSAWDPHLEKDIHRLEMVQRRAARFVRRDYRRTTSVTHLLAELQWPLLSERRTNSRLTLFYKAENNLCSISLDHLQRPTRHTRSADGTTFRTLSAHTNTYKYSFFPRTVIDWNSLSSDIRSKPSIQSFQSALSRAPPNFQ